VVWPAAYPVNVTLLHSSEGFAIMWEQLNPNLHTIGKVQLNWHHGVYETQAEDAQRIQQWIEFLAITRGSGAGKNSAARLLAPATMRSITSAEPRTRGFEVVTSVDYPA
jgi:hypothetical protein